MPTMWINGNLGLIPEWKHEKQHHIQGSSRYATYLFLPHGGGYEKQQYRIQLRLHNWIENTYKNTLLLVHILK